MLNPFKYPHKALKLFHMLAQQIKCFNALSPICHPVGTQAEEIVPDRQGKRM